MKREKERQWKKSFILGLKMKSCYHIWTIYCLERINDCVIISSYRKTYLIYITHKWYYSRSSVPLLSSMFKTPLFIFFLLIFDMRLESWLAPTSSSPEAPSFISRTPDFFRSLWELLLRILLTSREPPSTLSSLSWKDPLSPVSLFFELDLSLLEAGLSKLTSSN